MQVCADGALHVKTFGVTFITELIFSLVKQLIARVRLFLQHALLSLSGRLVLQVNAGSIQCAVGLEVLRVAAYNLAICCKILMKQVLLITDATQCTVCPVGHYCPYGSENTPSITPLECPPGTYNPMNGSIDLLSCNECDAGKSCNTSGLEFPNGDCAQVG